MFDIGAPELLLLVVIAVILFGPEKLPEFARKAARVVRYVRTMAGNAQQQLRDELGPGFEDVDVRDLNPKAFIQKHLLDDVEPIVADVKTELGEVRTLGRSASGEVSAAIDEAKHVSPGGPTPVLDALPPRVLTPFDAEAT